MRRRVATALGTRAATWMKAAALGAVVGSRSLLVPALVSRTTRRVKASRAWSLLAVAEIAADKTPWIPPRTAPLSLAARMLLGSAVAFGMASSSSRRPRSRSSRGVALGAALVGASSAAASAFLLRALRRRLSLLAGNVRGGVLEDLVAIGAGLALTQVPADGTTARRPCRVHATRAAGHARPVRRLRWIVLGTEPRRRCRRGAVDRRLLRRRA